MKKTTLFVYLLLTQVYTQANAQRSSIDEFKDRLSVAKEDTTRVKLLDSLAESYFAASFDSVIFYSEQGLSLANKINYYRGRVSCLNNIGYVFYYTGNYASALDKLISALKIAEEYNDSAGIARSLGNLGVAYNLQGDYRQAIIYSLKAKEFDHALMGDIGYLTDLVTIGDSYEKLNILDSARMYTEEAYQLAQHLKQDDYTGITLNNLGNIFAKKGQTGLAMAYYKQAVEYLTISNNTDAICESTLGIAGLFHKTNQSDSSIKYAKQSLRIARQSGLPLRILNSARLLTEMYKVHSMYDSAFVYQEMTIAAKDSLYSQEKVKQFLSYRFTEEMRNKETLNKAIAYQERLKRNILIGTSVILLVLIIILYKNNLNKKKSNHLLLLQKQKVERTLVKLKSTQSQLVQSEKMASLGELTAGIAHEIQNPLNFVTNFSELNKELLTEMINEIDNGNLTDAKEIARDVVINEEKINSHGKRADAIVKGMLQHSRSGSGAKELTDINKLADEYLRLAYLSFKGKDNVIAIKIDTYPDDTMGKISVIPQEIGRVLLNLYNNAFYAVNERQKAEGLTLKANGLPYEPTVSLITKKAEGRVLISVKDNGNGIPKKVLDKIFQPFFTTKPSGQGTGLGLSLSYDIIKAHSGELKVYTTEGQGSEFTIILPLSK